MQPKPYDIQQVTKTRYKAKTADIASNASNCCLNKTMTYGIPSATKVFNKGIDRAFGQCNQCQ